MQLEELKWADHLDKVLLIKPAKVVQEACQVLEKHGCPVKKLKSKLRYSSTLCQLDGGTCTNYINCFIAHLCVPSTALCQLDSGTYTNCIDSFNAHLHHLLKAAFQTV